MAGSISRESRVCERKSPAIAVMPGDAAVVTAFPGAIRIEADPNNSGPVYIGMSEEERLKQGDSLLPKYIDGLPNLAA